MSEPFAEAAPDETPPRPEDYLPTLARIVELHVECVLKAVDGNKSRAARILGINRRSIYRHIAKLEKKS